MENRKKNTGKFSTLPVDFTKMVNEVFASNFDGGLKELQKLKKTEATFDASGRIYSDEIIVAVTLVQGEQISATTTYASVDYDPRASSPTLQDLLGACVDAIGAVFSQYLNPEEPEKIEQIADESLSALEEAPFEWTPISVEKHKVFVRMDKANPKLDQMADDWLAKHDPDYQERLKEEQEETEKLFVTGPRKKPGAGDLH